MANEEALRKQAIALYQQGKKVATIAREIGRTRQWVHKWIKRYDASSVLSACVLRANDSTHRLKCHNGIT